MIVLGLYLPKLGSLIQALIVLTISGLFLSLYTTKRYKLPTYKTPFLVFSGGVIVFFLLVLKTSHVDMGRYGDLTREWTETNHSDAILALIEVLDVGWGKFYIIGGMFLGLVVALLLNRVTKSAS
jgi:hypothetical protein